MGAGSMWEISVLSAPSCCEPKTAQKYKIYLKGKKSFGISVMVAQYFKCTECYWIVRFKTTNFIVCEFCLNLFLKGILKTKQSLW